MSPRNIKVEVMIGYRIDIENSNTGGLNQGLLTQFVDFLIAEVFLHEIYRAAKI